MTRAPLLRSPALHFLLLGSVLFFAQGLLDRPGAARVLQVSAARLEQLDLQWRATHRRPPTTTEQEQLVERWIEEEILYREALAAGLDRADRSVCNRLVLNMQFLELDDSAQDQRALCDRARELGLDRGDPVIRRQLASMMRLVLRAGALSEEVSREGLEDYAARHPERFRTPDRIRWSQVFLGSDARGEALATDAQRLFDRLVADGVAPEQAARWGDRLPTGGLADRPTARNLERQLGRAFARQVMELPTGSWSEPIRSGFGLHLVWIHERIEGELRPWPEIEEQARRGLAAERKEQRYKTALAQLRDRWQVSRPEGAPLVVAERNAA